MARFVSLCNKNFWLWSCKLGDIPSKRWIRETFVIFVRTTVGQCVLFRHKTSFYCWLALANSSISFRNLTPFFRSRCCCSFFSFLLSVVVFLYVVFAPNCYASFPSSETLTLFLSSFFVDTWLSPAPFARQLLFTAPFLLGCFFFSCLCMSSNVRLISMIPFIKFGLLRVGFIRLLSSFEIGGVALILLVLVFQFLGLLPYRQISGLWSRIRSQR